MRLTHFRWKLVFPDKHRVFQCFKANPGVICRVHIVFKIILEKIGMANPRVTSEKCNQYGKKSDKRSDYGNGHSFTIYSGKIQHYRTQYNNKKCHRNKRLYHNQHESQQSNDSKGDPVFTENLVGRLILDICPEQTEHRHCQHCRSKSETSHLQPAACPIDIIRKYRANQQEQQLMC